MDAYVRELKALLNGEVEKFAFSRYFTYMVDGDEAILDTDARSYLEGALGCTLQETPLAQGRLLKLCIPDYAIPRAQKLVESAKH